MGNGIDSSVQTTGTYSVGSIDSDLAPWLMMGTKWGSGTLGSGVNLTFSFSDASSSYKSNYGEGQNNGVFAFNAAQEAAAASAMGAYAAVAGITFNEVAESASLAGDIRWANTTSNSVPTAEAYYPHGSAVGGDIWFGDDYGSYYQNPVAGTYGYATFIHELGHALGLKHPHDGSPVGPGNHDALKFSVMSYNDYVGDNHDSYESNFFPTTLMMDDIIAIQTLYGVNYATNAGDTVYTWGSSQQIFETIWDGGGNDTIDTSNMAQKVTINLTAGTFSSIGESFWNGQSNVRDCLGIAYNCAIENALGTSYADTLNGNSAENLLSGHSGNDKLNGKAGDDTLTGGDGTDSFRFDTKLSTKNNVDTITDFATTETLQLNNSKFTVLVDGALSAANFVANTTGMAADADDYIIYETDTGKTFYDADGSGAGTRVQFALIGTSIHPGLTAANFEIV